MNAAVYLQRHGWRGEGYSLDQADRGLAKPLLQKHKFDSHGIGSSSYNPSNQWWLNAFDNQLKAIGTSKEIVPIVPERLSGLYSNFVKSDTLKSTFDDSDILLQLSVTTSTHRTSDAIDSMPETSEEGNGQPGRILEQEAAPEGESWKERARREKKERKELKKRKKAKENDSTTESKKKRKRDHDINREMSDKIAHRASTGSKDRGNHLNTTTDEHSKPTTNGTNGTATALTDGIFAGSAQEQPNEEDPQLLNTSSDDVEQDASSDGPKDEEAKKSKKQRKREELELYGKERPREKRERRKRERREKHLENTAKKREKSGVEEERMVNNDAAQVVDKNTTVEAGEEGAEGEAKPPHPESIAALRANGQHVDLPGDPRDPDFTRGQLIRAYERGDTHYANIIVDKAYPRPPDDDTNKKRKADKYDRERTKREKKREARHWVEVRLRPQDYRPDGTRISAKEQGIPKEVVKEKRQKVKEDRRLKAAEKEARRQLKEKLKVEKRAARKLARAQKKIENHKKQMEHISEKKRKQRMEADLAEAEARGLSLEEFRRERREQQQAERITRRDEKLAQMTPEEREEYEKHREEQIAKHKAAIEARRKARQANGDSRGEDDEWEDLEYDSEDPEALVRSEMGKDFGRSAMDKVWVKHLAEQRGLASTPLISSKNKDEFGSDPGQDNPSKPVNGDDENFISLAAYENDSSSSPGSDSDSSEDLGPSGAQAADDQAMTDSPFIVDTTGDPELPKAVANAPKKVKEMTKEERKARLEAMRERRAERKALREGPEGKKPPVLTKKERRKKRRERKDELINTMARDILNKRRAEKKARGEDPGPLAAPIPGDAGKDQRYGFRSREEQKKARREARRVMRGVKKGKVDQNELPEHWRMKGMQGKGKKKFRGNGGREPDMPDWVREHRQKTGNPSGQGIF